MELFAPTLSLIRDRLDTARTSGLQQEIGRAILGLYAPAEGQVNRLTIVDFEKLLDLADQESGSPHASIERLVLLHGLKRQNAVSVDVQKCIERIDRTVFETTRRQLRSDGIAFAGSGAAALNYFMLHPETADYARQLVQAIDRRTSPENVLDGQRKKPALYNELTSLLVALVNAGHRNLATPSMLQWIESAVKYILHSLTAITNDTDAQPAGGFSEREALFTSKTIWARGDLSEVVLLYRVATLFSDAFYRQMADRLGLDTLMHREPAQTTIRHADFRQGAAGIAYTYDYLFRLTGYMAYQNGRHYWLTKTTELLNADLKSDYYAHREWYLLHGLVGVYLMLHAAVTHNRPSWSDIILL